MIKVLGRTVIQGACINIIKAIYSTLIANIILKGVGRGREYASSLFVHGKIKISYFHCTLSWEQTRVMTGANAMVHKEI